ncbi:hypothetical protein RRF57_001356 [Xylaria bambusicola]|uniref:O-methyltransferase dimerisation domain-containing protein n=1 Tax=Xylaria bambusicola TaxID=326684 RepID=A0AAN7YUV9_9PEZI
MKSYCNSSERFPDSRASEPIKMEEALSKIELLAKQSDELGRQDIMTSLHRLAYSLERPENTRDRYGFLHLQTAIVKVGFDLRLFKKLTESEKPLSVDEIGLKVGAQRDLMSRILRHLAAFNAVDELKAQRRREFVTVSQLVLTECYNTRFGTASPQFQKIPVLLQKNGYMNPIDETHTAFHEAYKTSINPFAWFENEPVLLHHFNQYMATRTRPDQSWLQVYPVREEVTDCPPTRPLYVNIGGGVGHQCAQFKAMYAELPGRVILQDLPHSIAQALPTSGVENMIHDFFEPQPIKSY